MWIPLPINTTVYTEMAERFGSNITFKNFETQGQVSGKWTQIVQAIQCLHNLVHSTFPQFVQMNKLYLAKVSLEIAAK